ASPSSLPPRRLAIAYTPPRSTQAAATALQAGVREMLNPPTPYRTVGRPAASGGGGGVVNPAVAVQDRRPGPVHGQPVAVQQEQAHLGAVLGAVGFLPGGHPDQQVDLRGGVHPQLQPSPADPVSV